jgi:hypothetical protein
VYTVAEIVFLLFNFEYRIVDVLGGNQQTIKMLYNLNERMPITGLRVERFPPTPAESNVSYFYTLVFFLLHVPVFQRLCTE